MLPMQTPKNNYKILNCCLWLMVTLAGLVSAPLIAEPNQYRLDSGDTINISVFGEAELSKEVLINNRGSINYPFLGELKVRGLSLSELEQAITNGLKPDYLINPNVSATIINYRPFFIEGQVKSAGAYAYQPRLTVAKAVVLAGGFTERASKDKIFIVKAGNKEHTEISANLTTEVQPGDIITVKQSFF